MIGTMLMALSLAAQSAPARLPMTLTPARLAQALQRAVGRHYGGGLTIARIFAEDRALVIVLDGPVGWRDTLNPAQVSEIFAHSFCEDADFDYFVEGNTMRVDTTEAGAEIRAGPIIRRCS